MNERGRGPIRIDNVQGSINLGTISGDNVAFGSNATVIVGPVDPELALRLARSVDDLAVRLAEIAHQNGLQQRQIELLTQDLNRVRAAVTADRPDEKAFSSAASDMWSTLTMIGNTVQGMTSLADGLKLIAGALGWSLALPFL
jgi:hypothetical protein